MELNNVTQLAQRGMTNAELQVLFEEDPHTFLEECTKSLLGRDNYFEDNLKMENYIDIQKMVLERMESDQTFAIQYSSVCFSFLCTFAAKIPESHQEFLWKQLASNKSSIRGAIFRLLRDGKITFDKNRFMVELQNEIESILNGEDNLAFQYALEVIQALGLRDFVVLLNGARQKFAQKIQELRTNPSEANIWIEQYLNNAIAGIQRILG